MEKMENGNKAIKEWFKRHPNTEIINTIINTGLGSTLCFDVTSGRYFLSDISKIKEGVSVFNAKLAQDEYKSLNDLYYELHLPYIDIGDVLGWDVMKLGTQDHLLHPVYTFMNADDGTSIFVIQFDSNQLPIFDETWYSRRSAPSYSYALSI